MLFVLCVLTSVLSRGLPTEEIALPIQSLSLDRPKIIGDGVDEVVEQLLSLYSDKTNLTSASERTQELKYLEKLYDWSRLHIDKKESYEGVVTVLNVACLPYQWRIGGDNRDFTEEQRVSEKGVPLALHMFPNGAENGCTPPLGKYKYQKSAVCTKLLNVLTKNEIFDIKTTPYAKEINAMLQTYPGYVEECDEQDVTVKLIKSQIERPEQYTSLPIFLPPFTRISVTMNEDALAYSPVLHIGVNADMLNENDICWKRFPDATKEVHLSRRTSFDSFLGGLVWFSSSETMDVDVELTFSRACKAPSYAPHSNHVLSPQREIITPHFIFSGSTKAIERTNADVWDSFEQAIQAVLLIAPHLRDVMPIRIVSDAQRAHDTTGSVFVITLDEVEEFLALKNDKTNNKIFETVFGPVPAVYLEHKLGIQKGETSNFVEPVVRLAEVFGWDLLRRIEYQADENTLVGNICSILSLNVFPYFELHGFQFSDELLLSGAPYNKWLETDLIKAEQTAGTKIEEETLDRYVDWVYEPGPDKVLFKPMTDSTSQLVKMKIKTSSNSPKMIKAIREAVISQLNGDEYDIDRRIRFVDIEEDGGEYPFTIAMLITPHNVNTIDTPSSIMLAHHLGNFTRNKTLNDLGLLVYDGIVDPQSLESFDIIEVPNIHGLFNVSQYVTRSDFGIDEEDTSPTASYPLIDVVYNEQGNTSFIRVTVTDQFIDNSQLPFLAADFGTLADFSLIGSLTSGRLETSLTDSHLITSLNPEFLMLRDFEKEEVIVGIRDAWDIPQWLNKGYYNIHGNVIDYVVEIDDEVISATPTVLVLSNSIIDAQLKPVFSTERAIILQKKATPIYVMSVTLEAQCLLDGSLLVKSLLIIGEELESVSCDSLLFDGECVSVFARTFDRNYSYELTLKTRTIGSESDRLIYHDKLDVRINGYDQVEIPVYFDAQCPIPADKTFSFSFLSPIVYPHDGKYQARLAIVFSIVGDETPLPGAPSDFNVNNIAFYATCPDVLGRKPVQSECLLESPHILDCTLEMADHNQVCNISVEYVNEGITINSATAQVQPVVAEFNPLSGGTILYGENYIISITLTNDGDTHLDIPAPSFQLECERVYDLDDVNCIVGDNILTCSVRFPQDLDVLGDCKIKAISDHFGTIEKNILVNPKVSYLLDGQSGTLDGTILYSPQERQTDIALSFTPKPPENYSYDDTSTKVSLICDNTDQPIACEPETNFTRCTFTPKGDYCSMQIDFISSHTIPSSSCVIVANSEGNSSLNRIYKSSLGECALDKTINIPSSMNFFATCNERIAYVRDDSTIIYLSDVSPRTITSIATTENICVGTTSQSLEIYEYNTLSPYLQYKGSISIDNRDDGAIDAKELEGCIEVTLAQNTQDSLVITSYTISSDVVTLLSPPEITEIPSTAVDVSAQFVTSLYVSQQRFIVLGDSTRLLILDSSYAPILERDNFGGLFVHSVMPDGTSCICFLTNSEDEIEGYLLTETTLKHMVTMTPQMHVQALEVCQSNQNYVLLVLGDGNAVVVYDLGYDEQSALYVKRSVTKTVPSQGTGQSLQCSGNEVRVGTHIFNAIMHSNNTPGPNEQDNIMALVIGLCVVVGVIVIIGVVLAVYFCVKRKHRRSKDSAVLQPPVAVPSPPEISHIPNTDSFEEPTRTSTNA